MTVPANNPRSKKTSETKELNGSRDAKGRFLSGSTGGPGRKLGSRNRLGEAFISDLHDAWVEHGKGVIDRVINDDPAQFLRTIAHLMPKEIDIDQSLNINIALAEARTFDQHYQVALQALEYIGADIEDEAEPEVIETDGAE
jgi:hypothetical protein